MPRRRKPRHLSGWTTATAEHRTLGYWHKCEVADHHKRETGWPGRSPRPFLLKGPAPQDRPQRSYDFTQASPDRHGVQVSTAVDELFGLPGPRQQPLELVGLGPAEVHLLKHIGEPRQGTRPRSSFQELYSVPVGTLLASLFHPGRLTVLGGTAVGRASGLPGSRRPGVKVLPSSRDGRAPLSRAAAPRPRPAAPWPPARRSRRPPAGRLRRSRAWRNARSTQALTGIPASSAAAIAASRTWSPMPLIAQPLAKPAPPPADRAATLKAGPWLRAMASCAAAVGLSARRIIERSDLRPQPS